MTNGSESEYLKRVYDAFSTLDWTCRPPHSVVQVLRRSLVVVQAIFRVVGRSSRRSQLHHNFGHRPAHLLGRSFALTALPGTQTGLHQWTRQHQVIVHDGDDLTPAFKLRWGTQPGLCPQQSLLVEAIAMLVRVASPVAQGDLWHTVIRLAIPQKPTLARVAGPIGGPMTQHADDRHFEMACMWQMQPRPPGDLDGMTFSIAALPPAISLAIGAGVAT